MKTNYAYFVWAVVLITAWLSFIVSTWLAVLTGEPRYYSLVFWLVASIILAFVPGANQK